jgi:hypothetical protein
MFRRSIVVLSAIVLVLAFAPAVIAGAHGTDRPLTGTLTGELNFVRTPSDPSCPVWTMTDGTGTMSHLGLVRAVSSHCMPTHLGGQWVTTAADGDQLFAEYTVPRIPFRVYITGGTGRFVGASGWFDWDVHFWGDVDATGWPVSPWHFEGTLEGVISY